MKVSEATKMQIRKVAFIALYIGAVVSLLYIIGLDILKSSLIVGFVYYLVIAASFSAVTGMIGFAYFFAKKMGKNPPGIFSMMMGYLTPEQAGNLATHGFSGKLAIIMREYLMIRMDILIPSGLVFVGTMFYTVPQAATTTANAIMFAQVAAIYTLSYLIYTVLTTFLVSVRIAGSIPPEEPLNMDTIIEETFSAATIW